MEENYLAKWLNGELTDEELAAFEKSEGFETYQKIKKNAQELEGPSFKEDETWNKIQDRIKKGSIESSKVVPLNRFRPFLRVAAVIALVLGAVYLFVDQGNNTFNTGVADTTELSLPDNSEVVLNAASQLKYNEEEWGTQREVLLKGEAFFKVAKGEKFTVVTDQGSVSVLGTEFNVVARDGLFEVQCFEGLVSVNYDGKEHKLPIGNSITLVDNRVEYGSAIPNGLPDWMNHESTFNSIPLKYVFNELERQFKVSVKTRNIDLQQLFTGTFSNRDLNLALESIATPVHISYDRDGDQILFYAENTP